MPVKLASVLRVIVISLPMKARRCRQWWCLAKNATLWPKVWITFSAKRQHLQSRSWSPEDGARFAQQDRHLINSSKTQHLMSLWLCQGDQSNMSIIHANRSADAGQHFWKNSAKRRGIMPCSTPIHWLMCTIEWALIGAPCSQSHRYKMIQGSKIYRKYHIESSLKESGCLLYVWDQFPLANKPKNASNGIFATFDDYCGNSPPQLSEEKNSWILRFLSNQSMRRC